MSESLGVVLLFLFVLVTSAKDVYVSFLLTRVPIFELLFVLFLVVSILFNVCFALTTKTRIRLFLSSKGDAAFISLSTLVGWITFFYALKLLEPAVVTSITSSIGPILTTFILGKNNQLEENSAAFRHDKMFCFATFFLIMILVLQTALGASALGPVKMSSLIIGIAASVTCGIANVINTFCVSRLNSKGMKTLQILSFRFVPLLIFSGFGWLSLPNEHVLSPRDWLAFSTLATIGIALPLFMIQEGIRRSSHMITALVHATIPVFVLLFEFFDSRFNITLQSMSWIIALSSLSFFWVLQKSVNQFGDSLVARK